jgi:Domain of unknown function (DUF1707)
MATGYNVRVGDADRDAVAAQLREHYAVGRLTLEELNERLDQTFAAKTKADLNTVMRDLPPAPRPAVGTRPGGPGDGAWSGLGYGSGNWGGSQGNQGPYRPFGAFAPALGLVWLFVILGSLFLFDGIGGGGRPLAIVLFLAALALVRRLFALGRRRNGGGPRGPRGPRGCRR